MNISSSAFEGMDRAIEKVSRAARNIASAGAEGRDVVDLSRSAVELIQAQNAFAANAVVVHTAQELEKRLLDLVA